MSLLRREHFSLAVNLLRNSSVILHITKRDFSQLNCFPIDQLMRLWASDFNSVWHRLPCPLLKSLLKGDCLDICLTTSFPVCNFIYTSAMRVIFFLKLSKIYSRFQKLRKEFGKPFCVLDYCIWIGCVKLCLLRREKLSSAVNVLTNSPKILDITKKDFSQLNWLDSDQWIW